MNNVFVYCEIEGTTVAEVSQELLTFLTEWTNSSSLTEKTSSRTHRPRIPISW